MPRTRKRIIDIGNYHKCFLCDYEVKNNKIAMKFHFKYSHPEEVYEEKENDRLLCAVCKKINCKLH